MSEPDRNLLETAAGCYLRLDMAAEAARCLHDAGLYRRAAELFAGLGQIREAAVDYGRSGERDLAAWLLVDQVDDPAAARAQLTLPMVGDTASAPTSVRSLRQRLVLARCEVAAEGSDRAALGVLAEACVELAKATVRYDSYVEPWAVGLAESLGREDQVALLFAAAVRGNRPGAARRWAQWSRRVLDAELILSPQPVLAAGGADAATNAATASSTEVGT